jgi:hypothetical protein
MQDYEQEDGDYCIEMADEKGNFSFNTYADKVCIGATTEDLSYVKEETRYWENDIQEKTYTIFIAIN